MDKDIMSFLVQWESGRTRQNLLHSVRESKAKGSTKRSFRASYPSIFCTHQTCPVFQRFPTLDTLRNFFVRSMPEVLRSGVSRRSLICIRTLSATSLCSCQSCAVRGRPQRPPSSRCQAAELYSVRARARLYPCSNSALTEEPNQKRTDCR